MKRHRHPDHAATLGRAAIAGLARRGTFRRAIDTAAATGPARPSYARLRAAWQAASTRAREAADALTRAAALPDVPGLAAAARLARVRLEHASEAADAIQARAEEIAAGLAALSYARHPEERIARCPRCGGVRPRAGRCELCARPTNGAE